MTQKASSSYTVTKIDYHENKIEADVVLDAQHDLFLGHFPGNPIMPGVLNIEIIQSIIKSTLGDYHIDKIIQLKFLRPVVPGDSNELHYTIDLTPKEDKVISLSIKGLSKSEIHLKAQILILPD